MAPKRASKRKPKAPKKADAKAAASKDTVPPSPVAATEEGDDLPPPSTPSQKPIPHFAKAGPLASLPDQAFENPYVRWGLPIPKNFLRPIIPSKSNDPRYSTTNRIETVHGTDRHDKTGEVGNDFPASPLVDVEMQKEAEDETPAWVKRRMEKGRNITKPDHQRASSLHSSQAGSSDEDSEKSAGAGEGEEEVTKPRSASKKKAKADPTATAAQADRRRSGRKNARVAYTE